MALSLKVEIALSKQQKVMRFLPEMSVSEVIQMIREKTNVGGADHGIYLPPAEGKTVGKWLNDTKTLMFYDLQSGDSIVYKKKHRPLKIRLVDGTVKTILVDESLNIQKLVEIIGEKINIFNPEEYSLMIDGAKQGDWLHPNLTLSEQHIGEDTLVVLRKKFFVTDANIDRSDPLQLHLLYVQSKDALLLGMNPCTTVEAVQFGALQAQVEFGNYNADKVKAGFLKERLPDLLPRPLLKKMIKAKADKDLDKEWRKLVGMTDINAKYRYVQLCRSLKTYGITFFTVKEAPVSDRERARGKLVERLMGVTRDAVIRFDPTSMEMLNKWPLTHIKRWSSSPTSFTLDFGDHESNYYTVQTLEGQNISQHLAGYIDIFLKRRRDGPMLAQEDGSERAVEEATVPTFGTAVAANLGSTAMGANYLNTANMSMMNAPQGMYGMGYNGPEQMGLMGGDGGMFNPALGIYGGAVPMDLEMSDVLQQMMSFGPAAMPETPGEMFSTSSAGLLKGARAFIEGAAPLNDKQRESCFSMLDANIEAMLRAAQAAAEVDQDISLIDGATVLAGAIRDLLATQRDVLNNPDAAAREGALQGLAQQLAAAEGLLAAIEAHDLADFPSAQLVMASGRCAADAMERLAEFCIAGGEPLASLRADALKAAKLLHATAVTVGPGATSPACKSLLETSARAANSNIAALLAAAQGVFANDPALSSGLAEAAARVAQALGQMMDATGLASKRAAAEANTADLENFVKLVNDNIDVVLHSGGVKESVTAGVKGACTNCANVVRSGKALADGCEDMALAQDLMGSVKNVRELASGLLNCAKAVAGAPNDMDAFQRLLESAGALSSAVTNIEVKAKASLLNQTLRQASKSAAAALQHLVLAADGATPSCPPSIQSSMREPTRQTQNAVGLLVKDLSGACTNPADARAHGALFLSAKDAARLGSALVETCMRATPNVSDVTRQTQLKESVGSVKTALQELLQVCNDVAQATGGVDFEEGRSRLDASLAEVQSAQLNADAGMLYVPGSNRNDAMMLLQSSIRRAQETVAGLEGALQRGNAGELGKCSSAVGSAVGHTVTCGKSVAVATPDRAGQTNILACTRAVADHSKGLVAAAQNASMDPTNPRVCQDVTSSAAFVNAALRDLEVAAASAGTGAAECEAAIVSIRESAQRVRVDGARPEGMSFADCIAGLRDVKDAVLAGLRQLHSQASSDPSAVGQSATIVADGMGRFSTNLTTAIACAPLEGHKPVIAAAGGDFAESVCSVLATTKNANRDNAASIMAIGDAIKGVDPTVRRLMDSLNGAVPGQQEILDALSEIDVVLGSGDSAFAGQNLGDLITACKTLANTIGQIVAAARSFPQRLGPHAKQAGSCVSSIVTVAHSLSSGGSDGGLDPLTAAAVAGCDKLTAASSKQAAVSASKDIGVSCTKLLQGMKADMDKEQDTEKKQQLARAYAEMGAAVANVIKGTKSFYGDQISKPELNTTASGLRSTLLARACPSKGGANTEVSQLRNAATAVAEATAKLLTFTKEAAMNPKDATSQANLSTAAKATGDTIKSLIGTAKSLAPGAKECEKAVEIIQTTLGDLDAASISASVGMLEVELNGKSFQDCQEDIVLFAKELNQTSDKLTNAALGNVSDIGPGATGLAHVIEKLGESSKQLACLTTDSSAQQDNLSFVKNVADASLMLVQRVRELSLNPEDAKHAAGLTEVQESIKAAIGSLVASFKGVIVGLRDCDKAKEMVDVAIPGCAQAGAPGAKSFQQCSDELSGCSKDIAKAVSDLVHTCKSTPDQVGTVSLSLAQHAPMFVRVALAVKGTIGDAGVQQSIGQASQSVLEACSSIIAGAKLVATDSQNRAHQKFMSEAFNKMTDAIARLNTAVRAGASADRACDQAVDDLSATMADLDAASLFAASGQMDTVVLPGATLLGCHQQFLETANAMEAAASQLAVLANGHSQDELGRGASQFGETGKQLALHVKSTAALVGDMLSQQGMLTSTKNVISAALGLIVGAKEMQANPSAAAQGELTAATSRVTESIQQLVEYTQATTQEVLQTEREIEAAKAKISAALEVFNSPQPTQPSATKAVLAALRAIAGSAAQLVASYSSSQEDLLKATRSAAASTCDMLQHAKGTHAVANKLHDLPPADMEAAKRDLLATSAACAATTIALLDGIRVQRKDDPASNQAISDMSSSLSDRVQDVIGVLHNLGEEEDLEQNDLQKLAEKELLEAAKSIEASAARLREAGPRRERAPNAPLDEQDIADAIIDAARAITRATKVLVESATVVQRELTAKGKGPNKANVYKRDPAWAQGLISAARAVAGTTDDMVLYANKASLNEVGQEMLVAAVRGVGGATARLVSASKAKADPNSPSQRKLEQAAKHVAEATQGLADAAKTAARMQEESKLGVQEDAFRNKRVQELELNAKMVKLEMELEKTRQNLAAARKAEYQQGSTEGFQPTVKAPTFSPNRALPPRPAPAGGMWKRPMPKRPS